MLKKIIAVAGAVVALQAAVFAIPADYVMKHLTSSMFTPGSKVVIGPLADTNCTDAANYMGLQHRMWFLENNVVVPPTCTLQVLPGTVIGGSFDVHDAAKTSLLLMTPGSYLICNGTPDSQIIFTTLRDDPNDASDFGPGAKGLWGGVLWCGDAPVSMPQPGYPEGIPANIPNVWYGGSNPHHNGGSMKYTCIEHGGCAVASNSETNGLSLYALGDQTIVDHVEVFANSDDGFEFFGGTVNTKYLVSVFNNDDHFDLDEGFSGKNQFWFGLEQEYEGDRGTECDGKHSDADLFVSRPVLYNFTYIGGGATSINPLIPNDKGNQGIMMRDSMGGTWCNGIVEEFGSWAVIRGKHSIDYNTIAKPFGNSGDSIRMQGNIFYHCRNSYSWSGMVTPSSDIPYLKANSNDTLDPMLRGIGRERNSFKLDPRPKAGSPALAGYVALPAGDAFFTAAPYRGAFSSTDLWIDGWTELSKQGICTKLLSITPDNGAEIGRTGDVMRMSFFLKVPGVGVSTSNPALSVKIDGVEVKSTFLSKVRNYSLTDGGYCFYVEYPTGVSFVPAAANPLIGPHKVSAVFPLTNGQTVKGNGSWTFLQN